MSFPAWISIVVSLSILAVLLLRRDVPADLVFLSGLVVITLLGIIPPSEALAGFANPAVITIGALFVVAAGLRETGVLDWFGNLLLGPAKTTGQALLRLSGALVGSSAFINNTAVVAMFVPIVLEWCRKRGIAASKLMIPVSFLTILGGTCSLIGTSANLVANGLTREERLKAETDGLYTPEFRAELHDMTLFEIGRVGLPVALLGGTFLLTFGRRLLPDRTDLLERLDDECREYLVEMLVEPGCRLVGQTVEAAGLRHLRGLFLIEIQRKGQILAPAAPGDVVYAGDHLVFTGVVGTIVDLVKIPGLVPVTGRQRRSKSDQAERHLSEAVISKSSPLVGRTVRGSNFRRRYGAAVVAVHRNGERLTCKVGDIRLEPGDTLLLQTQPEFSSQFRNSPDFYLVAAVEGSQPRRHHRAWLALTLLAGLVLWINATGWLPLTGRLAGFGSVPIAAVAVAVLMVATRCLRAAQARAAVNIQVLLTIAAALGLGQALTDSGAADAVAQVLVRTVGTDHPYLLLIVLYLLTMCFTELITNAATVAILIPLGIAMASTAACSPRPFIMAIALAASLSFLTPFGYQTNLMVMGPGGYVPRDFLRVGLPLSIVVTAASLLLIPHVWPLR
ncbi:MAG: SLC13 family permease [Pirellulales bacterium]|nr:SLC13 family permease [Pirellulales bacterium]